MAYKALIRSPETADYWATQSFVLDTEIHEQAKNTVGCWDVSIVYGRTTPTGTREDTVQFGLRIAKRTGAGAWGIGSTSELATIETALGVLTGDLASNMVDAFTCREFVWHERRASHAAAEGGGEKTGPAIRRTARATAGTASAARTADQIAMTVTFKTASRRHWGRVYLPGLSRALIDTTYGRWSNSICDQVATSFNTLFTSLNTGGFDVVVWSYPKQAFLTVTEIQVDNIVDIQRRRRAKQRSYAKAFTPTTS